MDSNDVYLLQYRSLTSGSQLADNVDPVTGEMLSNEYSMYPVNLEGYSVVQPIDISTIVNREIYANIVKEKIGKRRYRLWVSPLLLDTVVDRQLSPKALAVFCYLGQRIGYNNMVYVNTAEVIKEVGYNRGNTSLAITELIQAGLLKSPNHKLEGKGDRFFLVHPLYFFLGYYPMRDVLLRDWIKG